MGQPRTCGARERMIVRMSVTRETFRDLGARVLCELRRLVANLCTSRSVRKNFRYGGLASQIGAMVRLRRGRNSGRANEHVFATIFCRITGQRLRAARAEGAHFGVSGSSTSPRPEQRVDKYNK